MVAAAAVRQIRPMRRYTVRSTSLGSTVNMGFRGISRHVYHTSLRIKDGVKIERTYFPEKDNGQKR